MKMTKTRLFLLLASVLWLSSCEPPDDMSPMPEPESHSCLLKTEVLRFDEGSIITEYQYRRDTQLVLVTEFYDDESQQLDTVNIVGWENGVITYFYENRIEVDLEWDEKVLSKTKVRGAEEFRYIFNENGQLVQVYAQYPAWWTTRRPASFQYFWDEGNVAKIEARDSSDNLMYIDRIAYDNKNNPYTIFSYAKVALNLEDAPYYLSKSMARKVIRSHYEDGELIGEELKYDVKFRYNEYDYPDELIYERSDVSYRYSYTNCR